MRTALAYRDSALADPHLFALMFSGPTLLSAEAARRTVAGTALGPLRAAALRAVEEKALRPDTDTALVSLTLWTTVHGWVALQLRGFLPPSADDRCEDAVRAVLAVSWAGPSRRRRRGGRPRRRGRARCRPSR